MKILFLAPYPFDEVASQRFRFEQYFGELEKAGIYFEFDSFYTPRYFRYLYRRGNLTMKFLGLMTGFFRRMNHTIKSRSFDIVFIHRELTPAGPPVYEWLITRILRKKVIFDFDDAIWLNDKKENVLVAFLKWRAKIRKICKWSHRISAGNDFLADYARQHNTDVIINPTIIDTTSIPGGLKKHTDGPVTIGWTGTHSTLPYLLSRLPDIERFLEDNPESRLLIICNKKPEVTNDRINFLEWNQSTEWEDLAKIDIGIMPLPDDEWARGKCGFKILQYFSAGIPALASPVGINTTLIRQGENGFLCTTGKEWHQGLKKLALDPDLRERLGKNGYRLVEDRFSLTANRRVFLRFFE